MNLKIVKKRIQSLLRDTEFHEVLIDIEMGADESLFSSYFDEDFIVSLNVEGARERGHTLTASRPITKVKHSLKSQQGLDLLFAHESDANYFVERFKEQAKQVIEMLREKSVGDEDKVEDVEI